MTAAGLHLSHTYYNVTLCYIKTEWQILMKLDVVHLQQTKTEMYKK